jgi:hypothetical protein
MGRDCGGRLQPRGSGGAGADTQSPPAGKAPERVKITTAERLLRDRLPARLGDPRPDRGLFTAADVDRPHFNLGKSIERQPRDREALSQ